MNNRNKNAKSTSQIFLALELKKIIVRKTKSEEEWNRPYY